MRYFARRGGMFLITLWAALTVNFAIPRVMPGNEAAAVLATFRGVNPAAEHALEIEFGINVHQQPDLELFHLPGQLLHWPVRVTRSGRVGRAFDRQSMPWTLGLVGVTTVIAFLIGTLRRHLQRLGTGRQARRAAAAVPVHRLDLAGVLRRSAAALRVPVKLGWLPLSGNYDIGASPSLRRCHSSGTCSSTRSCRGSAW